MGRYLLVANQTLGGAELEEIIRRRIEAGPAQFHVVVPMIEVREEVRGYVPTDPSFAIPQPSVQDDGPTPLEQAQERSRHRLDRMVAKIASLGGEAEGEIGASDAKAAVEDALTRFTPDEVIVSTLPVGLSRWLKLDLPSRIERLVEVPVTVVEARESRAA